jgi:hypothetical protein
MGKEIQIKCTTNPPLRFVEHCSVFVSFKKEEPIDSKYEKSTSLDEPGWRHQNKRVDIPDNHDAICIPGMHNITVRSG